MKKEENDIKGQAIYVNNILALSSYHYCCTKAICITYSACVSVTTVIQHAKRIRRIILSTAAVPYFSPLPPKQYDFRGGGFLNTKCAFSFSLKLLSETFFILRRIQRSIIINALTSSCKVPVTLVRF